MTGAEELWRARTSRGEVVLRRHRSSGALELRVNGVLAMDDRETGTEVALARAALERHPSPRRVLVGGLGLGFTARAVLADARVDHLLVAEIEEPLVGWFADGTVPGGEALLADPRLEVSVGDVRDVLAGLGSLDLVLLDVDNGPDGLVHAGNAAVYGVGFLIEVRAHLAPGGRVSIWSATRSQALEQALRTVFGAYDEQRLPVVLQGREEDYWLIGAVR